MYQALYRKYRPINFNEVVGQDVIIQTLTNSILSKKISHAYLFTGPRGTGKTTVAKIFAKTVNCIDPIKGMPCNNCVSCTQLDLKQSTDVIEIDAASNNGVDEIREIKDKVNLVPSISKYKVYIIDEVHMLTTGAFNALLKTLEEPPAHVIFILATTEPHKIPLTILSRCQRFDFKKIASEKIIFRLLEIIKSEKIEIENDALDEIAYLSDGGMRDSISILDQTLSYSDKKITLEDVHSVNGTISKKEMINFLENIFNSDIKETLELIKKYDSAGKNLVKIVEEIVILLKNVLIYKLLPNYFDVNVSNDYKTISKKINEKNINFIIDSFTDVMNKLKYADNPKLILDLLLMKIFYFIKDDSSLGNGDLPKEIYKEKEKKEEQKINNKKDILENKIEIDSSKISRETPNKIKLIQGKRVENILAEFDKRKLGEIKNSINMVNDYMFDSNYNKVVSIVLDGELKAASHRGLMFVYNSEFSANNFNENIIIIEELIEKIFKNKFKVIAIEKNNWEIIKKEFNSKTKEYVYIEEKYKIEDLLLTTSELDRNEINDFFGDIVEYN